MSIIFWVVWLRWWMRAERLLKTRRLDEAERWNSAAMACIPGIALGGIVDATIGIELLCWLVGV